MKLDSFSLPNCIAYVEDNAQQFEYYSFYGLWVFFMCVGVFFGVVCSCLCFVLFVWCVFFCSFSISNAYMYIFPLGVSGKTALRWKSAWEDPPAVNRPGLGTELLER